MRDRRSSSTDATTEATPARLLAFPEARGRRENRVVSRTERILTTVSVVVLLLFAIGWSWSIAMARSGEASALGATPATAAVASALTDAGAPSAAYLTDAMLTSLMPLAGE